MTGNPVGLVEFLLARLQERQQQAVSATAGPWKAECDGGLGERLDIVYVLGPDRALLAVTQTIDNASEGKPFEDAAFIGANDPAYVLQDIAAKRQRIQLLAVMIEGSAPLPNQPPGEDEITFATHSTAILLLKLEGAPFSSHPDWQPEWSVE